MRSQIVFLWCFFILLCCGTKNAESTSATTGQYAFSSLLTQADIIVKGYVQQVEDGAQWHQATFKIEGVLKGSPGGDAVQIGTPKSKRGGRLAHHLYLWASPLRLILFLKYDEKNTLWQIVNKDAGWLRSESELDRDIQAVVSAYQSNQALFSASGKQTLKTLFETSQNSAVKDRLLYNLEHILTVQDVDFLSSLLDSDRELDVIYGALIAGRRDVESLRFKMENLLSTSLSRRIQFHCIVGLGDLANSESRILVLSYLNDPDPGTRRVAIEAAGKIGGNEIVEPLKASYVLEADVGHRLAIITAINRLVNKEVSRDVFQDFQSVETHPVAASILQRKLNVQE